jgi:hypothetical protein
MLHIFLCKLDSLERVEPTETDDLQLASEWIPVEDVPQINLLPKQVREQFGALIESEHPMYLGSHFLEYNHG